MNHRMELLCSLWVVMVVVPRNPTIRSAWDRRVVEILRPPNRLSSRPAPTKMQSTV